MLDLFKLNFKNKRDKNMAFEDDTSAELEDSLAAPAAAYDEEALKKSIATKLEAYRPIEREANFKGPKYYQ